MSPIPGIIASSQTGGLATFNSIATVAGTGSSGTITFSNIPSNYKHLQIRYIGKSTQTGTAARYNYTIQFNSDTNANYSRHGLSSDGATISSSGSADQTSISTINVSIPNSASAYANMHGSGIIDIHDYSSTSKAKTLRAFVGNDVAASSSGRINLFSGLYFATPTAISTITITLATGSWTTTSSFALYGIKG